MAGANTPHRVSFMNILQQNAPAISPTWPSHPPQPLDAAFLFSTGNQFSLETS